MNLVSPPLHSSCRILIVEDEAILALGLRETLEDLGHTVVGTTASGEDAIRLAGELAPELVFMDIRLAGALDGIATAEHLRTTRHLPVVYLTAYADEETIRRAKITEPFGYLHKPCQPRDLRAAIELALYKHQAEARLRASEQRYAATVTSVGEGILAVDAQGRVLLVNPVAEFLTGWSDAEARGRPVAEVLPLLSEVTGVPLAHPVLEALRTGQPGRTPTVPGSILRRRDGTEMPIEATTAPIDPGDPAGTGTANGVGGGAVIVFRDVAERRRAEESLRYTQKLESLSVLAAGVAHDFNNLLTPILGYVALVAESLPADSPLVLMLHRAEQATRQAAELTQQLLAYAGQRTMNRQAVDLAALLGGMVPLLTAGRPSRVHFEEHLPADLPAIEGDPVQLRQVALNLIVNAYEALGEMTGTLRVRAAVRAVDLAYLRTGFLADPLPPGTYVSLEVTDTGSGIDPANLPRLFDPFFSTKLAGRGLGLAATLGIVRGHKGTLRVQSEVGRGSTFEVLLPCTDQTAEPAPVETLPPSVRLQGTVLVVAEDPSLRQLFRRLLELAGLTVLLIDCAEDLGAVLAQQRDTVDAIVFDVAGFGSSARVILKTLRDHAPAVPVILSAGLDPAEVIACCADQPPAAILHKPFRPGQLTALLARLIQRNPG